MYLLIIYRLFWKAT